MYEEKQLLNRIENSRGTIIGNKWVCAFGVLLVLFSFSSIFKASSGVGLIAAFIGASLGGYIVKIGNDGIQQAKLEQERAEEALRESRGHAS